MRLRRPSPFTWRMFLLYLGVPLTLLIAFYVFVALGR